MDGILDGMLWGRFELSTVLFCAVDLNCSRGFELNETRRSIECGRIISHCKTMTHCDEEEFCEFGNVVGLRRRSGGSGK